MAGPQATVRAVSVFADAARDLRRDGFCIVPNRLDEGLIGRLKSAADAQGEQWSQKFGERLRAQGSMVDVPHMNDPAFGELIAHPDVLGTLDALALGGATFTDGYIISKPAGSPPLFWHFDWVRLGRRQRLCR